MNTEIINKVETKYLKDMPELEVGDIVAVNTIIRDGEKKRIQKFQGIVIAIQGKGLTKTFTVRKISYGVGVEKIFPFNSTNISSVKVLRHSTVRRSKLYYLRDRVGKAAMKLKSGKIVEVPTEGKEVLEEDIEVQINEDSIDAPKEEKIETPEVAVEPVVEETPSEETK